MASPQGFNVKPPKSEELKNAGGFENEGATIHPRMAAPFVVLRGKFINRH